MCPKAKSECSVDGCEGMVDARMLCSKHWYRWRKHGDPLGGRTPQGSAMAWLEANVFIEDCGDECIVWPFGTNGNGYGALYVCGRKTLAHRYVFARVHGRPIAAGCDIAHAPIVCHRRLCVNPRHIREATRAGNNADMHADGTSCRVLSPGQVRSIRADTRRQVDIAVDHGVSQGLISRVKLRKSYGDVGG